MIFPNGLEGVIPISPGITVTRDFQLRGKRCRVTIMRDASGFYEMTIDDVSDALPRLLCHASEILTERDLDGIFRATSAKISLGPELNRK